MFRFGFLFAFILFYFFPFYQNQIVNKASTIFPSNGTFIYFMKSFLILATSVNISLCSYTLNKRHQSTLSLSSISIRLTIQIFSLSRRWCRVFSLKLKIVLKLKSWWIFIKAWNAKILVKLKSIEGKKLNLWLVYAFAHD